MSIGEIIDELLPALKRALDGVQSPGRIWTPAADVAKVWPAEEILKYAPDFGPAHFERAKRFARERRPEEALASGKLALERLGGDNERLRAVHAFMAKTYFAAGRPEEAKPHEDWIQSQARP